MGALPGIRHVDVDLGQHRVVVEGEPELMDEATIRFRIVQFGYPAEAASVLERHRSREA